MFYALRAPRFQLSINVSLHFTIYNLQYSVNIPKPNLPRLLRAARTAFTAQYHRFTSIGNRKSAIGNGKTQTQFTPCFTRCAHRICILESHIYAKNTSNIPPHAPENPKAKITHLLRATKTAFMTLNPRFSKNTIEKSPRMHVEIPNPKDPMFYTAHDPCF